MTAIMSRPRTYDELAVVAYVHGVVMIAGDTAFVRREKNATMAKS